MLNSKNTGASIFNLNFNKHNKSHLLRASLEGIAFSFVYGIDILKNDGFDSVKVLSTKGSRPFWIKMGAIQEESDRYKMKINL